MPQLLELGHDTVGHARDAFVKRGHEAGCGRRRRAEKLTFSVEAVHHAANKLQFVLQAEVDEVGVDEDAVWRNKGGVVLQE